MNSMSSHKCSRLSGEIVVPGDKSISHRALIIGSLVTGKIKIKNLGLRYLFYDYRNKQGHGIRENSTYGMNSPNLNLINETLLKICENKISDDCKIYHLDNHYSKGEHPIGNTKLMELI